MDEFSLGETDFERAVESEFRFLTEAPYHFRVCDAHGGKLRYEGNGVVLAVFQDPMSYELGINIWRTFVKGEATRPYTMGDLIRAADVGAANTYREFAATKSESIRKGLSKLASDLRAFGLPALGADPDFYTRVSAAREEAVREFGAEEAKRAARRDAEKAWKDGDFAKVVAAYSNVENGLTRAELARLEYARDHLD